MVYGFRELDSMMAESRNSWEHLIHTYKAETANRESHKSFETSNPTPNDIPPPPRPHLLIVSRHWGPHIQMRNCMGGAHSHANHYKEESIYLAHISRSHQGRKWSRNSGGWYHLWAEHSHTNHHWRQSLTDMATGQSDLGDSSVETLSDDSGLCHFENWNQLGQPHRWHKNEKKYIFFYSHRQKSKVQRLSSLEFLY